MHNMNDPVAAMNDLKSLVQIVSTDTVALLLKAGVISAEWQAKNADHSPQAAAKLLAKLLPEIKEMSTFITAIEKHVQEMAAEHGRKTPPHRRGLGPESLN